MGWQSVAFGTYQMGQERRCCMRKKGGARQFLSTCGHMRLDTGMMVTTPRKRCQNGHLQSKYFQMKHFHAFGCPAYRLHRDLQGGHSQPRWEQRAEPVVYLGGSPKHASSIALVLDLTTAHVSPQFHLKFDNLFETVSATRQNAQAQKSSWQQLCHFGSERKTKTKPTALRPIDQAQEGQVSHPSQSEELQAGVIPLDGPGQFFPEGQHEIDDRQAENSASEGEDSLMPEPPEAVVESVGWRSGRIRRPTQQLVESQEQLSQGIVSYFTSHESIDPRMYKEDLLLKEFETDPIQWLGQYYCNILQYFWRTILDIAIYWNIAIILQYFAILNEALQDCTNVVRW
jgi:hypothetical protein